VRTSAPWWFTMSPNSRGSVNPDPTNQHGRRSWQPNGGRPSWSADRATMPSTPLLPRARHSRWRATCIERCPRGSEGGCTERTGLISDEPGTSRAAHPVLAIGVTSSKRAANATPVTPSPRPSDQRPPDTGTWRSTLDGWVRDGAIRRDCLIALAMMVLAVLGLAWIVVSNGGSAVDHFLTAMLSAVTGMPTPVSRIAGWSTVGVAVLGTIAGARHLRRHRRGPAGSAEHRGQ